MIEITEAALETVLNIRAGEDNPDELGLRIEITGSRGSEYTYDLSFDEISNAVADDQLIEASGVTVIVPAETVEKLRGSVLDLPRTAGQGGLVIRNPNRPDPLAGIDLDLEGTIAEQVEQLLEQAINPSLAAPRRVRQPGRRRRVEQRLREDGRRLPGLFGQRAHARRGHQASDQGPGSRRVGRHRRHRPPGRREPVL